MARPFTTSKLLHLYHFGLIYLQTRFFYLPKVNTNNNRCVTRYHIYKLRNTLSQQMRNTLSHLQVASVTFMGGFFTLAPIKAKNKRNFFKAKQIQEAHLVILIFI